VPPRSKLSTNKRTRTRTCSAKSYPPPPAPVTPVAAVVPAAAPQSPAPASIAVPAPAVTAPVAVASVSAPVPAAVAPVVRPAPAPAASAPTAQPTSPPPLPPPAPSASTLANADPEITIFLNRWTSDWQSRNAAAYFSHYLPDFKGTSETRAEWETLRRSRIEGRSRISLAVLDVRVRMVSPTEARLVFRQDYDSDAFQEIGTKAMFLVKRDGRWLIEREFFTPAR
ncbi:MAG: nuclear transport factor 2 family protein, partial [Brachymonas sp.]|nr:nuclear transport factor 2 family protein [Brachymonas sp.]